MPDQNGMLLDNERQAIANMMRTKITPPACAWCGSPNWEIGPFIAASSPVRANGTVTTTTGPAIPLVMLMSPCGQVVHFAAKLFGVDIKPAPAPAEQA